MPSPQKYSFHDDYSEGAHPAVLEALNRTNISQQPGYGADEYCEEARSIIKDLIGSATASVYFTPGGTAANLLSIAASLRPHEAVIAAESGHIVGKEGGAAEATGHKILVEAGEDGKLTPTMIRVAVEKSSYFQYQPSAKMVYISNATEVGTVWTKAELLAVAAVCKELGLMILLDGARLGAALMSGKNDMSLKDIYESTDIFWIGGTKNGALIGEAVVIKDPVIGKEFPYHMKQRGMLLAKGRILGIQFCTLLKDDLFWSLARHANSAATVLSDLVVKMGYELRSKTEINQVFVILPPALVRNLERSFNFVVWERLSDQEWVVRLVTSWATDFVEVYRFCSLVGEFKSQLHISESA